MPRFLVLCILFPAATEYEFAKGGVDRQRGVKGDFFLVVRECGRGVGWNLRLVPGRGGDRGWSDHSEYPLPL